MQKRPPCGYASTICPTAAPNWWLVLPGCNNQPCGFNDLIDRPMLAMASYSVDVAFNNPLRERLGFYIFAGNSINGPFAYGQPFYTVGPLNGNNANHTFLLLDIANPACYASTTLTYSCSDDCVVTAVTAEAQPCEDGFFSVVLNVEANNEGKPSSWWAMAITMAFLTTPICPSPWGLLMAKMGLMSP